MRWHPLVLAAVAGFTSPAALAQHWAYSTPQRPNPPEVVDRAWPGGAIDRFVLRRLETDGLAPSPPAKPERLLRRVFLDLVGLPPTTPDLDAFLADPSPEAYAAVVERLLASPRFGEHWARHWLDLARYADSNGFQADQLRDSWAYRDWVIDALNADMPFDQFTIEQLAGDLLAEPTIAQRIATGFHRTVTCNVEAGVHPEENRVNQVFDRVATTGTVWLGTTLECAQCHDHKYDPFSQREFYQLFAFFNQTPLEVHNPSGKGVSYDFWGPKLELAYLPEQQAERSALTAELQQLREREANAVASAKRDQPAWERQIADALAKSARWVALRPETFASTGDEDFSVLDDGSVLIDGRLPGTATYTVTTTTDLESVTAFRVDTLTHPDLPGMGPGRGDAKRPNFILSEFGVTAGTPGDGAAHETIGLSGARADYSQQKWHVSKAIDGDRKTGWAIGGKGFHKDHWATFVTSEPVAAGGRILTFTLDQNYGRGRTIGRFRLSAWAGDPAVLDVPDDIRRLLTLPRQKSASEQARIRDYYVSAQPRIARLTRQTEALERRIAAIKPPTTLVMVEDTPRETHVMRRGNHLEPAELVTAGTPAALHPFGDELPRNRLGLARWIVDPRNPLTARVAVNRWWAQLFGRGIVATGEDFGTRGDRPTHPRLLDWLATELIANGWSMKHLLREIVLSATYRQTSRGPNGDNAHLARGPRFRLSAEAIRDNALVISGLLSPTMAGPPVFPPQPPGLWRQAGRNEPKYVVATDANRFRRGIYVVWRRAAPYPSFVNFDGPDRSACHPQRSRTNTPMQALTLMNDPAYVEMAAAFAHRILAADRSTVAERLQFAFRAALSRDPSPAETHHLERVITREHARLSAEPETVSRILRATDALSLEPEVDRTEHAAWIFVATILLNLDETITKR